MKELRIQEMSHDAYRPNRSNRVFQGNPNFVSFYNREVKSFFSTSESNGGLKSSKVYSSGTSYYPDDVEYGLQGGSLWTPGEKEIFFTSLSRNSINRIDDIKEALPNKSHIEIMNYYNTLKKELINIKKNGRKIKRHKLQSRLGEDEGRLFKMVRNSRNLIRYSELPIAYEMSEYFIKFEEIQSNLISKFERNKNNDENQRFKSFFSTYSSPADENREDSSLIDCEMATSLTNELYKHNQITPLSNLKLVPKLLFKSLILLEEITSSILRQIMCKVIESKVVRNWLNDREPQREINIKKADIRKAIENLGYRDPNKNFNLLKYFYDLKKNLHIDIVNDLQDEPSIMTDDEYEEFISNKNKLRKNNQLRKSKHMATGLTIFEGTSNIEPFVLEDSNVQPVASNSLIHISSLSSKNRTSLDSDRSRSQISSKIIIRESQKLEDFDRMNSRVYEHALLTYMISNNIDINEVNKSISNDADAEELLELWEEELNLKNNNQFEPQEDESIQDEMENNSQIDIKLPIEIDGEVLDNFDFQFASYTDEDEIENDNYDFY
ncbi:uncharacterized protein PRCAT00001312001 [Priceomyces carsonii]|uniref:uncharacterized protein n=1 Tax=Priceomyces carsonii TaxID=28549 RepID=UPI002ED8C56B|nr:unnamed protein product [Priceomyces carsonii]